jgi:hypothetical protein
MIVLGVTKMWEFRTESLLLIEAVGINVRPGYWDYASDGRENQS